LIDTQGSRYSTPTRKQAAAIKIDEGTWRYIQTDGISRSTTARIDDVLEKLYCTTTNNVFNGLEKILMATSSQDSLRATYSTANIWNMTS
jgi:hypothetical protein